MEITLKNSNSFDDLTFKGMTSVQGHDTPFPLGEHCDPDFGCVIFSQGHDTSLGHRQRSLYQVSFQPNV